MLDAVAQGRLRATVALVLSDEPSAYALVRARRRGIPTAVVERRQYPTREAFEAAMLRALATHRVQYIALAGFMRILSPAFVRRYRHRILNIHPALLPSFPGAHAVRDTLQYGATVTGVTVHLVDAGVDTGPIVLQQALPVHPRDTAATLLAKLHRIEHRLYPRALQLLLSGKLTVRGRRVIIKK